MIDQHRVPPDVVDMQMRANNGIYRVARITGCCQISQETGLQLVPGRDAPVLLVVAETGVDNDASAGRLDHQCVDAHLESSCLVRKIGLQPADRQHRLAGRLRQDKPAAPGHFEFHNLGDRDRPDPPFHCCLLGLHARYATPR